MDRTTNIGWHYDCLYYKVYDNVLESISTKNNIKQRYQIIPYCIRPFFEIDEVNNEIIKGNVSSQFTFEELRRKQVTTYDLISWSASIDLVEHYDEYLNLSSNVSSRLEIFYNCSLSWFGQFCQYTFDTYPTYNTSISFDIIVNKTFNEKSFSNTLNMTCYLYLKCDRGPAPACLDWREICDGKVDCLGNDVDEMNCFELETNECEENEFRCHNGMCIPEEFLNEGPRYPDCFDGTDEDNHLSKTSADVVPLDCSLNPAFWCEETDFAKRSRYFVCGDGERSDESILYVPVPGVRHKCTNSRDVTIKKSLLSYIEHSHLSYDCWFFLYCSTVEIFGRDCTRVCENNNVWGCYINITNKCRTSFVIFPKRPIIEAHVFLVYSTNKTIFFFSEQITMFPDYVCYDVRKCPFLPATSVLNINGTTCRSTKELGLHEFVDIIHFFQACLIVIGNELEINHTQSSLFQCPGTTKYISKHRVLDGVPNCYHGTDEINIDACQWNDKNRFKCSSENKCLSPVLVRNGVQDCRVGEDEVLNTFKDITFQKVCNGYEHLSPVLIDGLNETDETHCDDWPCNNLYTRCDGAWNCGNGADELNCGSTKCPRDTHECVSPLTKEVICLPIHLAGNGVVDCLGSTDERAYCRLQSLSNAYWRYRCWNHTVCTYNTEVCSGEACNHEELSKCSEDVKSVFNRLSEDRKLQFPVHGHFMLQPFVTQTLSLNSTTLPTDLSTYSIYNERFEIYRTETCNRGILIYVGSQLKVSCLCPPSYFGDRCQYQNQRVSLTLQFSRICAPECQGTFGIIVTLIDQDNIIYDHEQLTYTATHNCENKFLIYLLYQSQPKDMTKTYNIRIDGYNKTDLTYHASWILPVKFLFLPVNRISAHLFIPAHPVSVDSNCSIFCGHGQCFTYFNSRDQYFCRCYSGWFGVNCTISHNCNCSSDSKCLGHTNNQSICLCNLRKYGPRCRLSSICQNETCKNGGLCIPDDQRVSRNSFVCVCPSGFSGTTCEIRASEIHISFHNMEIPRSLRVHFITVQTKADPMRTTISTKIPFDRDTAIVRLSVSFHMIIIQILNQYFLTYINANYTYSSLFKIQIEPESQCLHIEQLFDNKTVVTYPLLRRIKYYHLLCKNQSKLKCFHDNEEYMCLCNEEGYANCFPFDFNTTYTCKRLGDCQNGAECLSDRPNCPQSIFCVCTDCFYGGKCQFNTKGFGLSLDAILGYQIRPHLPVNCQPVIVKISIAVTTIMLIIGLIGSILSIMTFRRANPLESGCRQYLLATSIVSLCITIVFSMKFLMLMLSQMSLITNMVGLRISCISIDFLLRVGPIIADWINASVAIDRLLTLMMGIKFDKKKSKQAVRWVILGIILVSVCSILHDPIHRQVIYDQEEDRRWCLVQYSSSIERYNSAINIIHFFLPFIINLVTAILIIVVAARKRSVTRQQQTYRELLREQFHQHKHLVISCIILVLLATPRLIISFISGCMKSARNPSLYLTGYFISFIPPSLTFFVFIVPSKLYRKEFKNATKKFRTIIGR